MEYRMNAFLLGICLDEAPLLFAFTLAVASAAPTSRTAAAGVDGAFIPVFVGLSIHEAPHVEMRGGISLSGIPRIGPRAHRGDAHNIFALRSHRDDFGPPIL